MTTRPTPPTGIAAILTVARTSSAGALRRGRLVGLVLLVGFACVVQAVALAFGEGRGSGFASFVDVVDSVYLGFVIPLALVYLGTAAFGDEWEGGTAPYLVGLPLARRDIVLGRWLVSGARGLLLVLPAVLVFYALCVAPHEGAFLEYLPDVAVIVGLLAALCLGYLAVFLFMGVVLKRAVMASFAYVLVFETAISRLPPGLATISLSFHTRNLMTQLTGNDQFSRQLFPDVELPSVAQSASMLAVYVAVFLGASAFSLRRKEVSGEALPATE